MEKAFHRRTAIRLRENIKQPNRRQGLLPQGGSVQFTFLKTIPRAACVDKLNSEMR